ncbi:hypothetical protein L9F63_015389, partial [Diploptera punctata]
PSCCLNYISCMFVMTPPAGAPFGRIPLPPMVWLMIFISGGVRPLSLQVGATAAEVVIGLTASMTMSEFNIALLLSSSPSSHNIVL